MRNRTPSFQKEHELVNYDKLLFSCYILDIGKYRFWHLNVYFCFRCREYRP